MIFFTIVVPVYNLENYLRRALDSIFRQDFNIDLFEVIAIDDGSSDSSLSILNKYAQRYSNLRVYHQNNQGVSVARNLGLKYASGQYVTFLDGDDEFYLDSLSRVYSILKSHDIDVLYCYSFVNDGTKKLKQSHRTPPSVKNYEVCSIKQLANFLNGGSVCGGFYKIKLLDKFKLKFPENIMNSEDAIFNYTLFSHNPSIMFSDIKLYMVHVRPGSASRSDSLTRAKHFSRNIDYIVDYMETEQMSEFQYQYLSLALFQSFGCGVDMLLKVGVNELCKIKEILHYKRLPALKAPKNLLFKKFQFFLLNHSFSVYLLIFKLRNKFK